MIDIFQTGWPPTFAAQTVYVKELIDRINEVVAARKKIIIRSYNEPTQSEWEAAYVTQTGLPLPIPVGTKLLWRNYSTGDVLWFTMSNDAALGDYSSGTPFQAVDTSFPKSTFRLLAVTDTQYVPSGISDLLPAHHIAFANKTFLSPLEKMLNQIVSMLIVYKLRSTQTANNQLLVTFYDSSFYNIISEATNTTHTSVSSTTLATLSSNLNTPNSVANSYSQGVVHLFNTSPAYNGTEPLPNMFGVSAMNYGTYVHTTFGTGVLRQERGAMVRYADPNPLIYIPNPRYQDTTVHITGKAWLYGFFATEPRDIENGD